MKTKTYVQAEDVSRNHNETVARKAGHGPGLRVKTHVKAGAQQINPQPTSTSNGPVG